MFFTDVIIPAMNKTLGLSETESDHRKLLRDVKSLIHENQPIVIVIVGVSRNGLLAHFIDSIIREKNKTYLISGCETLSELAKKVIKINTEKGQVLLLSIKPGLADNFSEIKRFFSPRMVIVDSVSHYHAMGDASLEQSIRQVSSMLEMLEKKETAILNVDDSGVRKLIKSGRCQKISYSTVEKADVWASDIEIEISGISYILNSQAEGLSSGRLKVISSLLGKQSVSLALGAASVGLVLGMNLSELKEGIQRLRLPRGVLNLLRGLNGSTILDDTYDSSPADALNSLEILRLLKGTRKIAVLGDMLNLGAFEEEEHRRVGRKCAEAGVNMLITLGKRSRYLADAYAMETILYGHRPNIRKADTPEEFIPEAENYLGLRSGDVVLIKGAGFLRLERLTHKLMVDKMMSSKLLVDRNLF